MKIIAAANAVTGEAHLSRHLKGMRLYLEGFVVVRLQPFGGLRLTSAASLARCLDAASRCLTKITGLIAHCRA